MTRNRRTPARLTRALMGLLLLAILLPVGVQQSEATFVAASANPGATFAAAGDFNTVAVVLTNPGTPLRGSVPVTATAASDHGITSVVFSTAPAGTGTWTIACTKTVAPYTCTFDTTTVADGLRDVRAVATDSAGYSRTSTVTNRRVDNTAPTATTTDPGSPLTGSVSVAGTAADGGSGLASVAHEYRSTTGAWTQFCTQATSPISCAWNTTSLADGLYDLRTVATDLAGNQTISAPVFNRRVDNTVPTVTLTDPGTPIDGTITLASTSGDGAGSGVASVRYEYKLGAGAWTTACTSATGPFSCTFNTGSVADGVYDFRATATDGVANATTSAVVTGRRIDNSAPTGVTLGAVAALMANPANLTANASDAGSGIASVRFQYAPAGTGTWTDACTDTTPAYTCAFNTSVPADGLYDLRALATDNAGNTTASTVQVNRRIDNTGPVVAITNPIAGRIRGVVSLDGTATDPAGVTNVTFEYRQGAGAWQAICSDPTASYTCGTIDTRVVADGTYDVRMSATDTAGHTTISPTLVIIIDNTAPNATNVQSANGGTLGRIDAGDTITFTWSEPMSPVSILPAWNGTSTPIRVRVNNNVAGGASTNDAIDLYNAAGTTRLNMMDATGQLRLNANYVSATANFNATMVMTGNTVTITIGTQVGTGGILTGVATSTSTNWDSSTAATDAVGNPASGNTVTETGAADRDF